ncbi:MAG: HDIG domain-containing protein [Clostridia bacterium]|nr:HDIG domain-containing protein [Clostridia bacterium]
MTGEKKTSGKRRGRVRAFLKSSAAVRVLICLAGAAILLAMFVVAIVPVRYDLQVGMVPTSTISATKDVVDEISTQQKREEAAAQVTPTYKYQEGVTETVLANYDQIFAQLRAVRQYGDTLDDQSPTRLYSREELQYARDMLTLVSLRDYQLTSLLHSTQEELETAYSLVYAALQSTMLGYVTQGQETTAANNIRQIVDFRISLPLGQNIVPAVLSACIQANMLIDQEATDAARDAARQAVEPVVYKQGQNIVVRGEGRITANQLAMLSTLGLLSGGEVDMPMYLGAALLVITVLVIMLLLLRQRENSVLQDTARLTLMLTVLVISLGLCLLARMVNSYAAPMLLCALLMTALLGLRTGLICNAALTILVAALAAGGSEEFTEVMVVLLITGLLSGTATALMMNVRTSRTWTMLSGLLGCAVDFLTILGLGLMTANELSGSIEHGLWKVGGSVLATFLCIGLQPLLEMIFNLPTPMKLLELSNPNQPLLRRLLLEAPGTYHHSTIVSNLAEAAAEAVNANPLLARVGGLYHDIGKLKRPSYFTENQMGGVNAHDHTDPEVSAAIITAHTKDGVALAKAYRLPQEIQTIIAEHHGDTPVMYFYHKALQQADGKPVDIGAYRYDGRPPRTKEGAIVLLCDTIEAAVRTMKNPTTEGIEEFIVKLVRGKLEDGQLSDCPLTLRDIDKICAAATTVLVGVFHERIEYPDMEEPKQRIIHPVETEETAEAEMPPAEATPVVVPEPVPTPGTLNVAQPQAREPMPVVMPEKPDTLLAVEMPPTIKPVGIDELVTIEPLPLKETEEEAQAAGTKETEEQA